MELTVRDVAALLGVSEKTIYRWLREGSLPSCRVNEQYRFHRAEILEWATARKLPVAANLFGEPPTAMPGLSEALAAGGIVYGLRGHDKDSVLRAAVEAMQLPARVDREQLWRVLAAREALASTGIGDGIAIPHVRTPIVLYIAQPTATLCFLEQPIEFGALDGQPVHCLFTLVSPTVHAHLHLLSRLAFALRNPDVKAVVVGHGQRDEIFAALRRVESGFASAAKAAGGG